jgi:hypothetical protein
MQFPTLVRAREINDWAKSSAGKVLLPELVSRLVKATVPRDELSKCEFSSEAETHRPGYDGITVTSKGTPYVPIGITYWEVVGVRAKPPLELTLTLRCSRQGYRAYRSYGLYRTYRAHVFLHRCQRHPIRIDLNLQIRQLSNVLDCLDQWDFCQGKRDSAAGIALQYDVDPAP